MRFAIRLRFFVAHLDEDRVYAISDSIVLDLVPLGEDELSERCGPHILPTQAPNQAAPGVGEDEWTHGSDAYLGPGDD
jgi:hypothetical protein